MKLLFLSENNLSLQLNKLNIKWRNAGKPEFVTSFGIVSGEAVVGNVGRSTRLNYTALGDNVILASRIEVLNKYYGTTVLVNSSVVSQTGSTYLFRHVDKVIVKGKAQAHEIYELLGPSENVSETTKLFKTDYERAYNHYLNRDFSGAMKYQESIDPLFQKEKSAQLLKETCDSFMKNAPNDDWKGIRIFK